MDRFITIQNNMIVGERYDSLNRMVQGEIVDDGSFGEVGQIWDGSKWVWEVEDVDPDAINIALLEAEGVL